MKTFRFHAQQGQEDQVCQLLRRHIGAAPRTTRTDKGVRVEIELPGDMSIRSVDRMLHAEGVPGASARRTLPIIKGDMVDVVYHPRAREWFKWVFKGKFMGTFRAHYHHANDSDYDYEGWTLISRSGEVR